MVNTTLKIFAFVMLLPIIFLVMYGIKRAGMDKEL